MDNESILILGGGISGLSAAWCLKKQDPHCQITLLEASPRLGGVIRTENHAGLLVEKGPRTFAVARCSHLLRLIQEVGLQEEILYSTGSSRYLWHRGSLRSVQSFFPKILMALCKEAWTPRKMVEEETIYDYCLRRFTKNIAETLLDPIVLGIYAGDIRKLSLRSCFPFLYECEKKNLSIFRAFLQRKSDSRLFTLKRGMESLIDALAQKLDIQTVLSCPVQKIEAEGVRAGGKFWKADRIISALPGHIVGSLTNQWPSFPTKSLWVVNLAFNQRVLPKPGFGYLVPSSAKEALMGMVWDSSIFPRKDSTTVITAMIRNQGDASWTASEVSRAIKTHLQSKELPFFYEANLLENAIPQFELGYRDHFRHFESELKRQYPSLTLVGNYINGVSVDACIETSLCCPVQRQMY